MLLKRSAKFGSFNAVTSFMAPLTDFSKERSFTSSVALTSLSPEIKQSQLIIDLIAKCVVFVVILTIATRCY